MREKTIGTYPLIRPTLCVAECYFEIVRMFVSQQRAHEAFSMSQGPLDYLVYPSLDHEKYLGSHFVFASFSFLIF